MESDNPALSHIGSSIERRSSIVDSACDARHDRPGSISSRAKFLTRDLITETSLQETSIDLQSALTLFLSKMDKMESIIDNITKTNTLLHERITAQEQDKVSLYPDSLEYQGDDFGDEVRPLFKELRPVNTEIDLTVGEVVRDQAEALFTSKYSLVAGLLNQNCSVPKTSGHLSSHSTSQGVKAAHSTSSKEKLADENDLNEGNEIIDQILTEKGSLQAYDPPILENLVSAVKNEE